MNVFPSDDEPYMAQDADFDWPKGAERKTVEFKLRRGVIVHGRLVEEPSGQPVVGARISYYQTYRNNPLYRDDYAERSAVSRTDGTFTTVVPFGPGHLLVQGPGPDFLHLSTSHSELGTGRGPNLPMYPDAADTPRL